ncbi:MAG: hypothetical protein IJM59_10065 [Proteobacteria bacterium]|nr:hypothetical protein [Pseudomonadota bacterium]
MKKFILLALAMLSFVLVTSCSEADFDDEFEEVSAAVLPGQPVYADGTQMNNLVAKRVAKKVNFWGKKEIVDEFKQFNVPNADLDVLYNVRIAEIANPGVHKNVIFMTAGQKISSSGHQNGITGQFATWDSNCGNVQCTGVSLDGRSMAMKLKAQNWFPNAWFAVAPDNNFDYTMSSAKRSRLVQGFTKWLEKKITPDTENIVLAGSSRGGCLVVLMAQELRKKSEYNHINIYVSSYDSVCKSDEFGITSTKINNPVRPSGTFYGGWATNLNAQFPNRGNLHIYHISGGQEIVALTGIRTFSGYSGSTPPGTGSDIDWGWYKQTWVPWAHKEIGNPYTRPAEGDRPQAIADTIDAQLWWLQNQL